MDPPDFIVCSYIGLIRVKKYENLSIVARKLACIWGSQPRYTQTF